VLRKKNKEVEWIEFELFQGLPLKHGVFTRKGGVSQGSAESLNLGRHTEDLEEHIRENQKRVSECFDFLPITYADQTHSDQVIEIAKSGEQVIGDALITNKKGIPLAIRHADCQAAIFYDPVHNALGVVHSGWRGNVLNIYKKTIEKMYERYQSTPEEILVAISPSLGPNASEFIHYKKEFPPSFWGFQVKPNYFDLWAIAEEQLIEAEILPHHIQIARICTYENSDDFFSHRRDKKRGNNATVACLL
jgi:YfiH family protein